MGRAVQRTLVFPVGGLEKRFSLQRQSPFTTALASNVRSFDTIEGRERGGSRPGLGKAFTLQLGNKGTIAISNVTDGATLTFSSATNTTKLVVGASAGDFPAVPELNSQQLVFDASGRSYTIVKHESTKIVHVSGDASSESVASGATVTYGANEVRMLDIMRSTNDQGQATFSDPFDGTSPTSVWTAGTWPLVDGIFVVADGEAKSNTATNNWYAGVLNDLGVNFSAGFTMRIVPSSLSANQLIRMFSRLNGTNSLSKSIYAELEGLVGGSRRYSIYIDDVFKVAGPFDFGLFPSWIEMNVSSSGIVTVRDDHGISVSYDSSGDSFADSSDKRFAIGFRDKTSGQASIKSLTITYTSSTGGFPPDAAVASAGGKLYRESSAGTLGSVSTGSIDNLVSDRQLMSADRLGKLYIADHGPVRRQDKTSGTGTGTVVDGVLDDTDANLDWSLLSIDPDGDVVEITNPTGIVGGVFASPFTSGVYGIDSIKTPSTAGLLLKDLSTGVALTSGDDIGNCNYRVVRGVKVYDSTANSLSLLTATDGKGDPPIGCDIVGVYKDRIVMAGDPDNPGVWYMSAVGDPNDWDFGNASIPVGGAVAAVSGDSDVGGLSVPITALVPHSDDTLIISGDSEMWVLRGDPTLGGTLNNVSRTIGIIDKFAYAITSDNLLLFLSRDGLYGMAASGSEPKPISQERLPEELKNVDTDLNDVSLVYDPEEFGVHIFVTPNGMSASTHFWFNLKQGAFWPVSLQTDHEPIVSVYHPRLNGDILGCRDGIVRMFDDGFTDDDGTAISSNLWIGPLILGSSTRDSGILEELQAVLDDTSGNISWSVHVGDSPESAFTSSALVSGTWQSGLNFKDRPSARGSYFFLQLSSSATTAWALSSINSLTRRAGELVKS